MQQAHIKPLKPLGNMMEHYGINEQRVIWFCNNKKKPEAFNESWANETPS